MREVQKSLSAARKSDNRIRRLKEDRKTKEAQWIQFQKESREAFLLEKQRFTSALAKIDEDIRAATTAGQESADMVQALVLHGMQAKMRKSGQMEESDGSWEALVNTEEPQMEPGFLRDAVLAAQRMNSAPATATSDGSMVPPEVAARILQVAMSTLAPPNGAPAAPPNAGPGQASIPPGLEPTWANNPGPPLLAPAGPAAPYLGSPSASVPDVPKAPPAGPTPAPSPPSKSRSQQRLPVKGAPLKTVHTGAPPGASLPEKLEAKRGVLFPFWHGAGWLRLPSYIEWSACCCQGAGRRRLRPGGRRDVCTYTGRRHTARGIAMLQGQGHGIMSCIGSRRLNCTYLQEPLSFARLNGDFSRLEGPLDLHAELGFQHGVCMFPLGQWIFFGQSERGDLRLLSSHPAGRSSAAIYARALFSCPAWHLLPMIALQAHLTCVLSPSYCPGTPPPGVLLHHTPVVWILSSSVAPWVHWNYATLWVDPCLLQWSCCRPATAQASRPPPQLVVIRLSSPMHLPRPGHNFSEVPNTCIGGSGAGTLRTFLRLLKTAAMQPGTVEFSLPQFCSCDCVARAPKSHIGGSGMTASQTSGIQQTLLVQALALPFCPSQDRWPQCCPCTRFTVFRSEFARAPKSHIGGSGMTAVHTLFPSSAANARGLPIVQSERETFWVTLSPRVTQVLNIQGILWALLTLGSILVPLARSVFVLLLLGLLRLGIWQRPTSSRLVSLFILPFRGRCCDLAVPLGKVARPGAVLDWSVHKTPKNRKHSNKRIAWWRRALGSLLAFLGASNLPGPYAVSFPCACWIFSPTCAAAMAREGWPDEWPARHSHVPVFTPVITEGVSDAWSPCHDPERLIRAEDSLRIRDLPWPSASDDTCPDSFLGCYVYTPHYYPVSVAVRMPSHADLRYAMDTLLDCAPGVPEGLFNAMVPIHPQRVPGYLSVIRFPAHIRGVHEGYSAVICDLTRIGGSYFATILPKNLSHEALTDFLAPLAPASEEQIRVFIGCRRHVWPPQALVTLRDGDAITAVRHVEATFLRHTAETLHDRTTWGTMQQFYAPDFAQATCVLHREDRYRIDTPIPRGIDLFDQIVTELQLDASRVAICSFPLEDLEVHGTRCPLTVAVADVAGPTGSHREPHRQDFFVLCDLRPLGLKPRFVYAHLPRLHLPSLAADLGIALPATFQVGVVGARLTGETIHVSHNCTLLFYAKEAETDDSVSMTDLSPVHEPPNSDGVSPSPAPDAGFEILTPPQYLDPTIPEGHGWNLGIDNFQAGTASSPPPSDPPPRHTERVEADNPARSATAWSYASVCTHMAGAWEDLGQEDRQSHAAEPAATEQHNPCPGAPADVTVDSAVGPSHALCGQPGVTSIIALVFTPDYHPEYIRARVQLPCGIEQVIDAMTADRYGPLAKLFPDLVPAKPQPQSGYLLFVSAPRWLTDRPAVILDCQRILQTVAACLLFPVITRESLLVAAGLGHGNDASVYVHGLLQPLHFGQRIQLVTGMVISFVPDSAGAPATYDLETRLQSPEGWDPNPPMPGPGYFPGKTFWVLTDGMPTRFTLGYDRQAYMHADLCEHLGSQEHRLQVVTAKPEVTNAFPRGYWTTTVLVATERIATVPFPPARIRDPSIALILDCRPLFLGFRWLLLGGPCIPVSELVALFQEHCPSTYTVVITGCDSVQQDNETVFRVQTGQVLEVSLSEEVQSSDPCGLDDDPPHAPTGGRSPDNEKFDTDRSPPRDEGTSPPSHRHHATQESRQRSRSPRGGESHCLSDSLSHEPHSSGARVAQLGCSQGSEPSFAPSVEEVLPPPSTLLFAAARFRVVVPEALSVTLSTLCHARSILPLSLCLAGLQFSTEQSGLGALPTPPGSDSIVVDFRVASAYEAARLAASRLGLPWPLLAPGHGSLSIQDAAPEDQDSIENPSQVEATFLILAPEYSHDSVTIPVAIPQTVSATLAQIEVCRSGLSRQLFPTLYSVHPQPDVRWGLVVAAPLWLATRVIICLDLTLIDGRIFATVAPPDLDKHILLNMAGLSGGVNVEVYVADQTEPAVYGAELFLSNGDCISFVPALEPLEFRCSLQAMLSAPFGWAGGPAFPQEPSDDRICAVSEGFYCDFLVRPDRAAFYRADLSARFQIPLRTLCVQPAAPRQSDVTIYGRFCRTVVSVSSGLQRADAEVALLDCRPILEGWSQAVTEGHWLDVGALRHSLSLAAPPGHLVEFSGCPRHWNWLWLHPGQVVVVTYVPVDLHGQSTPPLQPSSQSHDGNEGPQDPDDETAFGHGFHHTPAHRGVITAAHTQPEQAATPGTVSSLLKRTCDFLCEYKCFGLSWPIAHSRTHIDIDLGPFSKIVKWSLGLLEHANCVGHQDLTPDILPFSGATVKPVRSRSVPRLGSRRCQKGESCPRVPQDKLLVEPAHIGSTPDYALQEARTATRALGANWPFPPYRWVPQQAEPGDDHTSSSESLDTLIDVTFFLLTPGFTGEGVHLSVLLPQTIEDILELVQARRAGDRRGLFPNLVPVSPQPDPGWGVLLAIPPWVRHRVIVCLDLSLLDNRILAADVPVYVDYHTLCEKAGIAPDALVDVYLPEGVAPMQRGVDHLLWTGACVTFVHLGSPRPATFALAHMVRSHLGWESNPALPSDSLDNGYCVIGSGGSHLFRLHPDRARHYQADAALLVGVHPLRVVLTPALDQPTDVCIDGWECRGVVAATDRQERYDWNEGRTLIRVGILDCRAILMGWLVVHTWEDWLHLMPLRRNLDLSAPDGWHTVFPQFPRHWTWTWIQSGQVITVAYERDEAPPRQIEDEPHPGPATTFDSAPTDFDSSESGVSSASPSQPSRISWTDARATSEGEHLPVDARQCSWTQQRICLECDTDEAASKWSLGFSQDALPLGTLSLTPAWHFLTFRIPGFPLWAQQDHLEHVQLADPSAQTPWTCKLLQDPARTGTAADRAFDQARDATRRLGLEWPLPPYFWPLELEVDDADLSQDTDLYGTGLYDLSFYLLTPDYTLEQLELSVVLPQALWEVLDLIQTCRQADRAALFPSLIPVTPQPDPGWGVFLAVPDWPSSLVFVCCDLSFYDGRIVSVATPRQVDTHLLCELVGLSPHADVDIYLPYETVPTPRGTVCLLASGNLITFQRPGTRRHASFDIHAMLSSPIGWEHSPSFPRDRLENGHCVVSTGGPTFFRLQPEKASSCRADIALLTGLHPLHIELTSAVTHPDDICVRGWTCRTLLAARDGDCPQTPHFEQGATTVGFLDCRALLRGWVLVFAYDDWLDLRPIREMLQFNMPPGWHVTFPQLPRHWTGVWLTAGQILTVSLTRVPPPNGLESGMPSSRLSGPDGSSPRNFRTRDSYAPTDEDATQAGAFDRPNSFRREVVPRTRVGGQGRWPTALRQAWLLFLMTGFASAICGVLPIALLGGIAHGGGSFAFYLGISLLIHHHDGFAAGMHLPPYFSQGTKPVPAASIPSAVFQGRPIATPCRSTILSDRREESSYPDLQAQGHKLRRSSPRLVTLLEESAASSWHWAFMASTLLDTLFEHFQSAESPSQDESGPIELRLSDHLPSTRTFDLTALSVDFGTHFATAFELLVLGSWPLPFQPPSGELQHEGTRLGLQFAHPASKPTTSLHVYTDGSFDGSCSSWAFAVICPDPCHPSVLGWACGKVILDQEHRHYIGADRHSAIAGEQCALIWAIIWALQAPNVAELLLFSDCEVALRQATGRYGSAEAQVLAVICRHLFQALEAARPDFVPAIQHVRSHTGLPANELVDRLAKYAGGTVNGHSLVPCPPAGVAWCRSPSLPWLWIAYAQLHERGLWPTFTGSGLSDHDRLSSQPTLTPAACDAYFGLVDKAGQVSRSIWGRLCTFTLNTQTLADAKSDRDSAATDLTATFPGRTAFLREQFDYYGAHVVALQEARAASDGMLVSATHVRVFTGKDKKGNFGVELWLSRRHPFAHAGSLPLCFEPGHLLVLHASPRELFVKYCRGELRLLLISAHAPTTACPQRNVWWAEFSQRVGRYSGGCRVLLLGDLNIHLADPIDGAVGDIVFPTRHPLPPGFLSLLQQQNLWIPSTFSQCHSGPSATWWPPTGGPGSRLDYALLPTDWHVEAGGSQVFSALDWGQPHVDHFALRTFLSFSTRSVCPRAPSKLAFDRSAMLTDEGRVMLQTIFQSLPDCPWHTNVHEHYATVQQHLVQSLAAAFPPAKGRCRTSHFSTFTWQLRQKRVWLRKQVVRLRHLCGPEDVRAAWLSLQGFSRLWLARLLYALVHGRELCDAAGYVRELQQTRKQLKQAIRRDAQDRISSAAASAHTSSTGDVVSRLQSLLGPSARKARGPRQLPGLKLKDGTLVEDPDQMEQAWVEHFSGIEAGVQKTPLELATHCIKAQRSRDLDDLMISPSDLPTLAELETAFRQTMLHRAFGTDQIPAEALHGAPGAAAKALFPVILKCAFRLEEPLHFKGGSLYAVWKGKASPSLCASYRGILVSSTVGKAYHRILRARNVRPFETAASPLQVGGLPKRPVTLAAHVVRLHQNWSRGLRHSYGVLFLDLREAFYRIVRPLVIGFQGTDSDMAAVLAAVQLPPGVMHELHEHLAQTSLFREAGASQWTSEATCEALRSTWFRFEKGSTVTETGIGTRPGDNLADIVFGFVFAKVLGQVRQQVESTCGLVTLPWNEDMLHNPFR